MHSDINGNSCTVGSRYKIVLTRHNYVLLSMLLSAKKTTVAMPYEELFSYDVVTQVWPNQFHAMSISSITIVGNNAMLHVVRLVPNCWHTMMGRTT